MDCDCCGGAIPAGGEHWTAYSYLLCGPCYHADIATHPEPCRPPRITPRLRAALLGPWTPDAERYWLSHGRDRLDD